MKYEEYYEVYKILWRKKYNEALIVPWNIRKSIKKLLNQINNCCHRVAKLTRLSKNKFLFNNHTNK